VEGVVLDNRVVSGYLWAMPQLRFDVRDGRLYDQLVWAVRMRALPRDECWEWGHQRVPAGYGYVHLGPKNIQVHRVAYEAEKGAIPPGLHIDHLCRNRACCNPGHMEAVPHRVNVLRGVSPSATEARQTHCKRGHEFTPENTYYRKDKTGTRVGRIGRMCRECLRDYQKSESYLLGARRRDRIRRPPKRRLRRP
jgi:HNH endonuclease